MAEGTQDLVRRDAASQAVAHLTNDQIRYIAGTEFVPKGLRGNLPAIMACIQTGRELGLGDMESLRSVHVIDGRPSMSAELMVKQIRRRGHSITGEYGDGAVTVRGRRADNGDEMSVTWTRDMALRADLLKKDNWKKYPESMLWARAASQLARTLFPDCLGGVSHTPDELELSPEERIGEAIGDARPMTDGGPDDGPPAMSTDFPGQEFGPGDTVSTGEAIDGEAVEEDDEPDLEPTFEPPAEAVADPVVQAAVAAADFVIPNGQHKGTRLGDLPDKGERGSTWLAWALKHVENPPTYRDALTAYARVFFPEIYDEVAGGGTYG